MNAVTPTRTPVVDQIFGANKAPIEAVLAADFSDLAAEVAALVTRGQKLPAKVEAEEQQAAIGSYIIDCRALWKKIEAMRDAEGRPLLEGKRAIDAHFKGMGGLLDEVTGPLQRAADDFVRRVAAAKRAEAERQACEAREKAELERQKAEAAKTAGAAGRAEARAEQADAEADRAAEVASASAADLARMKVGGVSASAKETWTARIEDYNAAIQPLGAVGAYLKADALTDAFKSMAKVQKSNARWPGVSFFVDTKATFR